MVVTIAGQNAAWAGDDLADQTLAPLSQLTHYVGMGESHKGGHRRLSSRLTTGRSSADRTRILEDVDRQRTLEYFERLGKERVRLYAAVDCERFLGDWQVRELADQWLAEQDAVPRSRPLWRRLLRRPAVS